MKKPNLILLCLLSLCFIASTLCAQTDEGEINTQEWQKKFEAFSSDKELSIEQKQLKLLDLANEAQEAKEEELAGRAFYQAGLLAYQKGVFMDASLYFKQSLQAYTKVKNRAGVAKASNGLATALNVLANYSEAIHYYDLSLRTNLELKDTLGIAKTLNNLGDILRKTAKMERSIELLKKARSYYITLKDDRGLAGTYNNLGLSYFAQQQYDSALSNYERSRHLKEKLNDTRGLANTLNNIAIVYQAQGMLDKEFDYLKRAEALRKEINDLYGVLSSKLNLADFYRRSGMDAEAENMALSALNEAKQTNLKDAGVRALKTLYELKKGQKQFAEALKYHEEYLGLKDSVFTEKTNAEIVNLENLLDKQKVEAENRILKQANQIDSLKTSQQEILRWGLITIVLLLVFLLILVIVRLKKTREQNKNIIESEERFKLLANTPFVGIVIINELDEIIDCNQEFLRMIGLTKEQVRERGFSDYLVKHEGDLMGKTSYKLSSKAKEPIDILLYERETERDGKKLKIAAVNDVSRLKKFEKELVEARKNAEKLSTAKSQFLANMSHELRTPLNGVSAGIELIKKENLSEDGKEVLQIIESSADNLLGIINDLIDLTKVESGRLDLKLEEFNVGKLAAELHDMMKLRQEEKPQIKILVKIQGNMNTHVYGDVLRIKQVAFNLLANAIKFTQKGSVTLGITCADLGSQGINLTIEVADTGIGIAEENKPYIFEAFMQGDNTISKQYSGTGLGLSISKRLVQMMGGKLNFKSTQGEGSQFYFTLALKRAEGKNEMGGNVEEQTPNKEAEKYKGISVLLAEDNRMNQKLVEIFFKRLNIEMDLAEDGEEAVEKFIEKRYDLVLMDVQMPEKDGFTATQEIRKYERSNNKVKVPIVALTANAMKGDKEKCLEAGMDDFLSKPFKKQDLEAILSKYVLSNEHFLSRREET